MENLRYGAKELTRLIQSEEDPIIKCNGCDVHFYDSLGGEYDTYNLQLLYEENDVKEEFPYKGCGNCQTDDYLTNLD